MRLNFKKVVLWTAAVLLVPVAAFTIMWGPAIYHMVRNAHRYEVVAPVLPPVLADPAVLVFSKTNGFRDGSSIDAANAMFAALAKEHGWGAYFTENGAVFNAVQLARFKVVVWSSVSGDVLNAIQKQAFKDWIERGGGFIGVHGAGGDPSYQWRWYVENLIGAQFIGHPMWPQFQQATIRIEDPRHPAMKGLSGEWVRTDEWYSFDRSVRPKGYHVLATLDERTYRPVGVFRNDLSMGADHPIVWTHCVGHGRVFYSALGHAPETYSEPAHRRMLANAIIWAVGTPGDDCDQSVLRP